MKSFSRFKLWLSRVTALPYVTSLAMRDKISEIRNVQQLIAATSTWKPGTLLHGTDTSSMIRVALRRLMVCGMFGMFDAHSMVRFTNASVVPGINAEAYDINILDDKGNWAFTGFSLMSNHDDYELYVVSDEVLHGPACVPSMI